MKVGIMQPYFFPYIGYWQLMNAVDKYVIYDDVNFINRGWVNRNRILLNGQPHYFNVQMTGASQSKLISEILINKDEAVISKNLRVLENAYKKAPYFSKVQPLMEKMLRNENEILSEYIADSFAIICSYLDIHTERIMSSDLHKDNSLKGQDKILAICQLLGATQYYNAIGGRELYSCSAFRRHGIELKFLKTDEISYKQFDNEFCANLSIIDVMMFNSKERIKRMLDLYTLV